MSIDQFLALFNGIFCDFDGAFEDQCFDLANYYARFVVGGAPFSGQGAYQIFDQAGELYEQIANTPDNMPQKGDIVIWANEFNNAGGHVGIATGANTDVTHFEVLEQNDPAGSNCHLKEYSYDHVRGWLRPKHIIDPLAECLSMHTTLVTQANEKDQEIQTLQDKITGLQTQLDAANNHITELESQTPASASVTVDATNQTHDVPLSSQTPEAVAQKFPTLKKFFSELRDLLSTPV